jgi:putative hydrolase of the HAD superfamily
MKKPRVVLFDLGNVLVHIHPEAFLRTLGLDSPENRARYGQRIVDIVKEYERGRESTEQYLNRLDALLAADGHRFTPTELTRAMLTVIGSPLEGMEELVRRVGERAHLGLLSNTNPLHYHHCLEHLPALRHIPVHFLSYQLLALKPEPAIYQGVVDAMGLPAEDILFVDDIEENVTGARTVGLQGIRFTAPSDLETELRARELV